MSQVLLFFTFGGSAIIATCLFYGQGNEDKFLEKICGSVLAVLLFICGIALATAKEKYEVDKGKIIKHVNILGFSKVKVFFGTHAFLRERSRMSKGKVYYTYELYVGKKVGALSNNNPFDITGPGIDMFVTSGELAIFGIPQNFIMTVAKDFETQEIFEESTHFYTENDYVNPDNTEIWLGNSKRWDKSYWSKYACE